jgi:hypothetical protein
MPCRESRRGGRAGRGAQESSLALAEIDAARCPTSSGSALEIWSLSPCA